MARISEVEAFDLTDFPIQWSLQGDSGWSLTCPWDWKNALRPYIADMTITGDQVTMPKARLEKMLADVWVLGKED